MKKILIFSLQYYPTHIGGAEVAIKEITDRIAPSDIGFHMITNQFDADQPRVETIGHVTVHRVGWGKHGATVSDTFSFLFYISKILFVPLAAWKGIQLHRRYRFDATWSMMTYMAFPTALMRCVGVRIPSIVTLQDGDPFERVFSRWYILPVKWLLLYGIRSAAVVQTISSFLAGWAQQIGYMGRIEIVPNAVNVKRFSRDYPRAEVEKVQRTLQKKAGETLVVTTSRLVHKNAVDDMIRALPLLPASIVFIVLGAGPDEAMLRALAAEKGVSDRVRFMGNIGQQELPLYLKACDIFIRASRSEGMGISFIEAMAAGLPVVATQEGGISDFLFDAKRNTDKSSTGWAVDRDSPQQIAEAVKDIIEHPEKAAQRVAAAQAMVTEKYDWELIAQEMRERVFGTVL